MDLIAAAVMNASLDVGSETSVGLWAEEEEEEGGGGCV